MPSTNIDTPSGRVSGLLRATPISANAVAIAVVTIDIVVLVVAGFVTFQLYTEWTNAAWAARRYPLYMSAVETNAILTVVIYYFNGFYRQSAITRPRRILSSMLLTSGGIFVFFLVLAFALKASDEFSRGWVFFWGLSNPFAIYAGRLALGKILGCAGLQDRLKRNVVVVGGGEQAERLVERLQDRAEEPHLRFIGIFDERVARRDPDSTGALRSGDLDSLIHLARRDQIDEILVALPWTAERRIHEIVGKLLSLPVSIRLSLDVIGLDLRYHRFTYDNGIPALNLSERPLSDGDRLVKRCFDVIVSLVAIVIVSPLLLAIALSVRLESPGGALFRQKRLGYNNKIIEVLKFRTLYVDSQDAGGSRLITRNDSRVTKVGRFLRRTSLDELPQLFNVLRGDMSLVGPRPHPLQATAAGMPYEKVVAEYSIRHKVKPGITGWAQINGWRGETDTTEKLSKRVEFDIKYIENWSFLFDVLIIARTIPSVVTGKGAY